MRNLLLTAFALGLCFVATSAIAQPVTISICDLQVDADVNCVVDTPPIGDLVAVEGVIVAWKEFGARGAGAIWDPVTDCCISIFDITDAPDLPTGQWVRVEGWVGQFAGLAEIVDNPADGTMDPVVTDMGTNYGAVPATKLEAADLADFSPLAETMESCLVELCGTFDTTETVFAGNANYNFVGTDGETCIVRVDTDTDLVGVAIPTELVAVTGILGQFNGFTDTCVGYQLLPRTTADVVVSECGPVPNDSKSWGELKGSYDN